MRPTVVSSTLNRKIRRNIFGHAGALAVFAFLLVIGYSIDSFGSATHLTPTTNSSIPHVKGIMGFKDSQGRIWIGWEGGQAVSSDKGVTWTGFRRRVFTNCTNINKFGINVYDSDETNLFTEDSSGNIWYATQGGGIVKLNGTDPTQTPTNFAPSSSPADWAFRSVIYNPNQNVFYTCITRASRRGASSAQYEFWIYDPTVTSRAENILDLVNRTLLGERVLIDSSSSCHAKEPTNVAAAWTNRSSQINSLLSSQLSGGSLTMYIEDMAIDNSGNLWIINRKNGNGSVSGTFGGIVKLVPSGKTSFSTAKAYNFTDAIPPSEAASSDLLAIEKASDGSLYAGTDEGGSFKYDSGADSWNALSGTFPRTVEDISEDTLGRVWFVGNDSSNHAVRYNPSTRAVDQTLSAQQIINDAGESTTAAGSSIKGVVVDNGGNVYFNFFPFNDTDQPQGLYRVDDFAITSTIALNQSQYGGINLTPVVTVTTADSVSSVQVNAKSTTDTTGITLSLSQVSRTKTFRAGFNLTSSGSSSGTTLRVSDGDTITVTYSTDGISDTATFDIGLVPAMGTWALGIAVLLISVLLIRRGRRWAL